MTRQRIEDLWTRFMEGARLRGDEEQELLETLCRDAVLRAELLGDKEIDGLLDAVVGGPDDESAVIAAFGERLEDERDATRFIKKVASRLAGEGSSPPERESRPPEGASRRSTRRWRRPAGGAGGWKLGLVAAGVIGTVIVYWALSSGGPAPSPKGGTAPLRAAKEALRKAEDDRARAQENRERLEIEGTEREEERRRLAEKLKQVQDAKAQEALKLREAELAKAVEAWREKLRAAQEKELEAAKAVARAAETPQEERIDSAQGKPVTQAGVAKVGRVEGEAYLVVKGEKKPAAAGQEIGAGQGVETGEANSIVEIAYPDESRLEMGAGTVVRELKSEGGKRVTVEKGLVRAEVARQPKGQPMVLETPHGEATVLGTTLRIVVDPDRKKGTRLEVVEGKVELKRRLDGKTVDVLSGHFAVAAVGVEFVAKPMPIEEILLLPKQGKISGVEWGIVPDKRAISGFALETIRDIIGNPKVPGYFQRKKAGSYVTFTFKADADKDYYVLIRGWCMAAAKRIEHDAVDIEVIGGQFVVPGPPFDLPGQGDTAVYYFDGFEAFEGYGWLGGQFTVIGNSRHPAIVRFSQAGQQTLRLYSEEPPMRVDAIWLSATQKEWPDPSCQGPGRPGRK